MPRTSVILNEVTNPDFSSLDLASPRKRVPHFSLLRCGLTAAAILLVLPTQAATTLTHIRQTKTLRCGINQETPEYSSSDDHGPRAAFDADICRAVAVAILGPNARTTIAAYPDDVAATAALHANRIDLIPTQTLDLTHASDPTLTFSPPLLYDGVGLLVPIAAKITHATDLSNRKICFLAETQVELALRAWFDRQHLHFLPFPFQEEGEMEAAFVSGNCTALAGDLTRLASTRLAFGPLASRYTLLPDQISQDPLAAASRSDDPAFAAIVEWTIEALLNAEAVGLTQPTVSARPASASTTREVSASSSKGLSSSDSEASLSSGSEGLSSSGSKGLSSTDSETSLSSGSEDLLSSRSEAKGSASPSPDPTLQVLTGQTREIGLRFGLDSAWATHVIAAVGNYAEIYDRNLGEQSAQKLPRAQNRLNTQGGLMLPLPLK